VLPEAQSAHSAQPLLSAHELRVTFSVIKSLWAWRLVPSRFVVLGSELSLQRNAEGNFAVQGVHLKASRVSPLLMVLAQPHVELRDIRVHWHDARGAIPDLVLSNINLYLRNSGNRHQLQVDLQLPAEAGKHLQFTADIRGAAQKVEDWRGEMYVSFVRCPWRVGWRKNHSRTGMWMELQIPSCGRHWKPAHLRHSEGRSRLRNPR